MDAKERAEEFLKKAREADNRAAHAMTPVARAAWKGVADGYRELASRQQGDSSSGNTEQ